MSYIYKITNLINGKLYIGKTCLSIIQRWQQHCKDRFSSPDRPLYRALNKYGTQNFEISCLEEVQNDNLASEREIYWIEHYGTFKHGYNATIGGDGRAYLDYDLIVSTYNQVQNQTKVAEILGINIQTVGRVLKERQVKSLSAQESSKLVNSKSVHMFNLKNEYIKTFTSISDAGRYLIENNLTGCKLSTIKQHISEVCRAKRKTIAGFIWKYGE